MTLSAAEVNDLKRSAVPDGLLPAIHSRWSPRSFADRPVSPADLATIFEAARWAASSYNEQPWRFLMGERDSIPYKRIFDSLIPFNQLWAASAPVLILGVTKIRFSHNDTPNRVALYDLGAAAANLSLQAISLGLYTHQMGGFDEAAVLKAFGIPENHIAGAVIALGYLGEPSALTNPQMLAQEVAPRQRKPLSEFVFSTWESPATLG